MLRHVRIERRASHMPLNCRLKDMMATHTPCPRTDRHSVRRKNPLPARLPARFRILPSQRIRQLDLAMPPGEILPMQEKLRRNLVAKHLRHQLRQNRQTIAPSLPIPHAKFAAIEVDILNTQP
jgi:hypothetical protein